ncbi:hypothetical protein [Streptomyces sp. NPDC093071]|uniref:hypothetical protein n=1 Tax=Streptomyces sp. NPDC093071 TaxID=3366022 RepID=UPI003806A1E7
MNSAVRRRMAGVVPAVALLPAATACSGTPQEAAPSSTPPSTPGRSTPMDIRVTLEAAP